MNRVNHPGSKGYLRKIRKVEPASLIGYWPLNEQSGDAAKDWSGAERHGTHVAVGYMGTGIGDGMRSLAYDGTTSYTNIYSAALASAFNGDEGTLLIWAKVADAGVWTDGIGRYLVAITAAGTNRMFILKDVANNSMGFTAAIGGTDETVTKTPVSETGWMSLAFTWSASSNAVKGYYNGVQEGSTQTIAGTWTGTPIDTYTRIGSYGAGLYWSGSLAHCALWSKALAPGDISFLSSL